MAGKKNYADVAKRIHHPAEIVSYRRILVYGRNKKGKTTFGMSAGIPNTLVLDPEGGTDEMKTKNPNVLAIEKWQDMDDAWGYLKLGDHPYDWVCVDGLTKLHNMALRFVMRQQEQKDLDRQPGRIIQRDYGQAGEMMKQMLTNFHGLKMGVIYTAQERMTSLDTGDNEDDDETTFFIPDLPAGVRGAVNSLVDVIGRIYAVKVEIKGETKTQRRLQIGPHERYDTGFRSDFLLPDMIKYPTIPKLITLMDDGEIKPKKRK